MTTVRSYGARFGVSSALFGLAGSGCRVQAARWNRKLPRVLPPGEAHESSDTPARLLARTRSFASDADTRVRA
jgi:hypothetical protein